MNIYSIEWNINNPKALLIAFHGLGTYTGIMRNYFERLVGLNLLVCAPDLPYHGKSTGEPKGWVNSFEMILDVSNKYIDVVKEKYNANGTLPLLIIGHSMGGLIVSTLAQKRKDITGVIGSAPGYQINNVYLYYFYYLLLLFLFFFPLFFQKTIYSDAGFPRRDVRLAFEKDDLVIKKTYIKSMTQLVKYGDIDMKKDVHVPFLLYVGKNDGVVTVKGCQIKATHLKHPKSKFIEYDNCLHCLYEEHNLDEQIRNIDAFINDLL